LWLAVIMTPPSSLRLKVAKYESSVPPTPMSSTSTPESVRPLTTAAMIAGLDSLMSRPTATVRGLTNAA
jgi:hypothetical protein